MDHVVIIGNGISGITAARFIRKSSDLKITVISDEQFYFSQDCFNVCVHGTYEVFTNSTL